MILNDILFYLYAKRPFILPIRRYSYVLNDPITYTDPTGYDAISEAEYLFALNYITEAEYNRILLESMYPFPTAISPIQWYDMYGMSDSATAYYMWEYQVAAELEGLLNEGIANGSVTYTLPDPRQCVEDRILEHVYNIDQVLGEILGPTADRVNIIGTGAKNTNIEIDNIIVNRLLLRLDQLGFARNDQGFFLTRIMVGKAHDGYEINARQPVLFNSLQVNIHIDEFNPTIGSVQIDVDFGNPARGFGLGGFFHILQVVYNRIFNTDNTYGCYCGVN